MSFEDRSVNRHFFARADAQPVAGANGIEAHFFVRTVVADTPRGFWRKIEKRLYRVRSVFARSEFQHLSQQDKNRDDGCGLKIDRNRSVRAPKSLRKKPRH